MTFTRTLNLTAAALLLGGLFIAGWCLFTATYNGAWLLAILLVAGFCGITAKLDR